MATVKIVLTNPINVSLQAKASTVVDTLVENNGAWDILYFNRIKNGVANGDIKRMGKCVEVIPNKTIVVDADPAIADTEVSSATTYIVTIEVDATAQTPDAGDFIFFGKENKVNVSGVRGYFAEVEMRNDSTAPAKLFAVGSEITQSSK